MKIYNPSNNAINNIKIFGVTYSIEAEGTLENVPETHARYWQENIHKFLVLKKDKLETPKEPEVVPVPEPTIEEVAVETTVEPEVEIGTAETVTEDEVKSENEVAEESPVVAEKPKSKGRPKK